MFPSSVSVLTCVLVLVLFEVPECVFFRGLPESPAVFLSGYFILLVLTEIAGIKRVSTTHRVLECPGLQVSHLKASAAVCEQ